MRTTAAEIERHLIPLIGLQLSLIHRVADLCIFHFGEIRRVGEGKIGRYALHIQCPWRIEHDDYILTGRTDLWEAVDPDAVEDWETWNYERHPNLQDALLDTFLPSPESPGQTHRTTARQLIVEAIQTDNYGGATLTLAHNYRLVIFPAGSRGEDWRIFQPAMGSPHFVIVGGAIE